MDNMEQLLAFARACAKEAGKIHLSYFRGSHLNIETKFNQHDVVTVADKESERYIIGEISRVYPHHSILGVVYAPYLNELYEACKGRGAVLNGRPIRVSGKSDTQQSVVVTGFPIDKDRNPDNNLDNLARILPVVRGVRRFGSAAYDLCGVAAGFFDGYWEFNLNLWDVCAGMLIVAEAGGVVRSFRSDRKIAIVAGNEAIVEALASRLSDKPGKVVL